MFAIFYMGGSYIAINNSVQPMDVKKADELVEDPECVLHSQVYPTYNENDPVVSKLNIFLYGGMVEIKASNAQSLELRVNGIAIEHFSETYFTKYNLEQVVSALNTIEDKGIEEFLKNYQKALSFNLEKLKREQDVLAERQKLETSNPVVGKALDTINQSIRRLTNKITQLKENVVTVDADTINRNHRDINDKYFG